MGIVKVGHPGGHALIATHYCPVVEATQTAYNPNKSLRCPNAYHCLFLARGLVYTSARATIAELEKRSNNALNARNFLLVSSREELTPRGRPLVMGRDNLHLSLD